MKYPETVMRVGSVESPMGFGDWGLGREGLGRFKGISTLLSPSLGRDCGSFERPNINVNPVSYDSATRSSIERLFELELPPGVGGHAVPKTFDGRRRKCQGRSDEASKN
jgi:hypothetical protein